MKRKYYSSNQIRTLDDVHSFFHHLVYDLDLTFHPDDTFLDFVSPDDQDFYTEGNMELYDSLLAKCWEICEKNNADIYSIGMKYIYGRFFSHRIKHT